MALKVLEISINLASPGTTATDIEKAAAKMPKEAKFLDSCANGSSVFLFYDIVRAPDAPHS